MPNILEHCLSGNVGGVRKAVRKGEHTKIKDGAHSGHMGLMIAVRFHRHKVVQLLLQQPGIEASCRISDGSTALDFACVADNLRGLVLLLDQPGMGRVVNNRNSSGLTPLMVAVQHGHAKCVKVLLGVEGVDLDTRDDQGKGLQEWARWAGVYHC